MRSRRGPEVATEADEEYVVRGRRNSLDCVSSRPRRLVCNPLEAHNVVAGVRVVRGYPPNEGATGDISSNESLKFLLLGTGDARRVRFSCGCTSSWYPVDSPPSPLAPSCLRLALRNWPGPLAVFVSQHPALFMQALSWWPLPYLPNSFSGHMSPAPSPSAPPLHPSGPNPEVPPPRCRCRRDCPACAPSLPKRCILWLSTASLPRSSPRPALSPRRPTSLCPAVVAPPHRRSRR